MEHPDMADADNRPVHLMRCAKCGKPVIMYRGLPYRECEHFDAAIVADLRAACSGTGGVQ